MSLDHLPQNERAIAIAKVRAKPFPVCKTGLLMSDPAYAKALASVPWHVAERAYEEYARRYGRSQSLEQLAQRGGFGLGELDMFYPGWREAAEATAREVLDQVQALVHHADPAEALKAIKTTLEGWR